MRLKAEQLESALKKTLALVYLISGDDPLQSGEAADAIRKAVKKADYLIREVLTVETGFDWNQLAFTADSMSIFADKKLIDLRLGSAKPGTEGAKALQEFCQRLDKETVLLITAAKFTAATMKTKWVQSLDQAGVIVQIWPLEAAALIQWLQRRAQRKGLQISQDGLKVLASRVEGNLLAAAQEIEKLYAVHGETSVSKQAVEEMVADSARFDVFKLTDSLLSGHMNRAIKILNGLKAEGVAAPIIVWALARETRLLINIRLAIQQGQNKEGVYKNYRLWDKRKHLVNTALSRMDVKSLQKALLLCSQADKQIKGQEQGDYWETIFSLCQIFSMTMSKPQLGF